MGALFGPILQLDSDDLETFKSLVFSELGAPIINLEISDSQFITLISRGVQKLNIYAPKLVVQRRTVLPYTGQYLMLDYPKVNSVLNVIVSVDYLIGLGVPLEAIMKVPFSFTASRYPDIATEFATRFICYDFAKRMYGLDVSWELEHPNKVNLLPTPYMESVFGFILTVDHDTNLGSLTGFEREWLIIYTIAKTKTVIGRIRSKYSGVSLPVGSLDSDGQSMISEGREEEEALMEELVNYRKFAESYITTG